MRRHGRSRAFAENQSSNAPTSFEFLVLSFEFKNLPNREIHEIREKEMKKTRWLWSTVASERGNQASNAAMEAGIAYHFWSLDEIVDFIKAS